ncbi:MAG TPA: hypothetical protein DIS79_06355 [Bacteroidetes bacterium]|nr:hypothetical protein [Bacteroidota bacterium]HRK04086.1 hypothetical protein [Chlorobiota bacterium]
MQVPRRTVGVGTGTVTSVDIAVPAALTVSGGPITTNGTITLAWANQNANVVFAGPSTGSPATPTFRALVANDIPSLDAAKITTGQLVTARGGTGVDGSAAANGTVLIGNGSGFTLATLTAGSGINITNGSGSITITATGGGSGTVTSVGLAAPSELTVTNTPVTTTGTLTLAWANQNANIVFAGPSTGSPATPTFRALVANDIPSLDAAKITTGLLVTARGGTGVDGSAAANGTVLIGNGSGFTLATLTAGSGINITNGSGSITITATGGGSGTVTSVGLAAPSELTVTNTPVTTTGTLTLAWANQNANIVFAGPSTGSPATPTFRALVASDIPSLDAAKITTGQLVTARGGTGVDGSAAANGSLLIGNGSGYTLATLTAGTGISVTNGAGSITITATGGGATFNDSTFRIFNNADNTKQIGFDTSAVSASTTRTVTMVNRNVTLDTITINTTNIASGSSNRLLLQSDSTGVITQTSQLSYYINRFAFRNDGAIGSFAGVDFIPTGDYSALYVSSAQSSYTSTNALVHVNGPAWNTTTSVVRSLRLDAASNGTPASGFGQRIEFRLESSNTNQRDAASIDVLWTTATDTSRTSAIVFQGVWNATTMAEVFRLSGNGIQTSTVTTSQTSTFETIETVTLTSSGTVANSFGARRVIQLETSSNVREAMRDTILWVDATDTTRNSRYRIDLANGSNMLTVLELTGNGGISLGNAGNNTSVSVDGASVASLSVTSNSSGTAYLDVTTFSAGTSEIRVEGTKVLGSRITGWGVPTGPMSRATFATGSATVQDVAERLAQLIVDWQTHGALGT